MKTAAFFLGLLLAPLQALFAAEPVIVHEWGTFTSLQNGEGETIGGINVDDEPVPDFVRQVAIGAAPQYDSRSAPPRWRNLGLPPYNEGKGWVAGDPSVTMRLETPVIYIYPPKRKAPSSVPPLNVHVDFHGGVLSQFYPFAYFSGLPLMKIPEQPQMDGKIPYIDEKVGITENTTTSLEWKPLQIGATGQPEQTADKVWTIPREVSAPMLEVKFSEKDFSDKLQNYTQDERFLFYRGVGHLNPPLKVGGHGSLGGKPYLSINTPLLHGLEEPIKWAWLVQIKPDGTCAYHLLDHPEPLRVVFAMQLTYPVMPTSFTDGDFSVANLAGLKASMQEVLVKEGLYPDEASAMLRTWELSYFKSPGLRLFYMVPRSWVDKVLPLKITGAPAKITRVMVGRIEIETDAQKEALERLAKGPCPDLPAFKKAALAVLDTNKFSEAEKEAFYRGEKPLSELGIPIPLLIQDYLSLGRFRDALIVNMYSRRMSSSLMDFINDNRIGPAGKELTPPVRLPGSTDVTLKNPGRDSSTGLHY